MRFGQAVGRSALDSISAIARIMTAKTTDELQGALADHQSFTQRRLENQQARAERAQDLARREEEQQADRDFRLEILDRTEANESDRLNARLEREDARFEAQNQNARIKHANEVTKARQKRLADVEEPLGWLVANGVIGDQKAAELREGVLNGEEDPALGTT